MYRPSTDPAIQTIKGIFIFKKHEENDITEAFELLKSMSCEVLTVNKNRITIKASRGKLQEIKQCWLSNNSAKLSVSLNEHVSNIIIGGNCR